MQDKNASVDELYVVPIAASSKAVPQGELILEKPTSSALKKQQLVEVLPIDPKIETHAIQGASTAQIITWSMLFLGWCITVFLYKKNKSNTQNQRKIDQHNCYVKEFRDLIFNLESNSIEYWTNAPNKNDQVTSLKFQREIKELTAKAKEIENTGGVGYQSSLIIKLRRYVTLDNDNRPLNANCSRIDELRGIVSQLTKIYIRKSDY
jgi:hypothetical protein